MTDTAIPDLLAISDKEQAEHSLRDKQKALQQELGFLIKEFQSAGQVQSSLFIQESLEIFFLATESLLKNKLNFDAEKRRQQQGRLSDADQDFLLKRLNQYLSSVYQDWLKPELSNHCHKTANSDLLNTALLKLDQWLTGLKEGFPSWVADKTIGAS